MGNLIDLTKKAKIVLEKKKLVEVKAEIVVAIDRSGSMYRLYSDGTVQNLVERLLGIGMNMDANKEIDVFQFNQGSKYIGVATEENHANFVRDKKMSADGGTNYAPVMKEIIAKYSGTEKKGRLGSLFGKKSTEAVKPTHPTFVFFITDGDNSDEKETERLIRESANQPIFWQFVGIGNEPLKFLQKLDDLEGRYVDNADFFKVSNLKKTTDEELYEKLLTEFPSWLQEIKAKGLLS
ncbi:VWA domain-containing protein [Psychrobacillus sp. FSL H8-0510]|uniref:VWA domain-containing protein n=1 Tax=Psychrobacillus sp. FSL H8-0510 TaxID=2921394 RepID=UPI0030FCF4F2